MKLGIIGAGMIVRDFLPMLKKISELEIVAIMCREASLEKTRAFCKENDIPETVTDYEQLKNLGVDTVYVATPNSTHFAICKNAMELGFNVIVEKPITSNVEEAGKLKEIAISNKVFLYEAITTMYFKAYQKIKEWLPQIGEIKLAICNFSQYSSRYDAFKRGDIQPAFNPELSGGALMDLNLYNVYYVLGLFGVPMEVKYYANIERNIDTSGMLVMNYDGFVVSCTGAKDCGAPLYFMIEGNKGYISMKFPPNVMGEVSLNIRGQEEITYIEEYADDRAIPEFEHFINAIESGDYEDCKKHLEESLLVMDVLTKGRKGAGIIFPADKV